ncbi:DGAT2 [Symbiodinium microadriaticum]|nr:DGAT2 [Symbiodinium microadriaticum]
MLDYFDFETAFETSDDDLVARLEELKKEGRSMIFAGQPHGVLSFGGLCAGIAADSRFTDLVTAAAGAVLATPVVKHVVGIYGLIDASAKSLTRRLARGGAQGSVVLYTGGIAELFKTSDTEEILFINSRKGFIKLALRTGADIVPMYFFGNTSVLSVLKSSLLESLSRSYQISLTIFWGEFGLPIPRKHKEPTDEDVDKWHAKYVAEVRRIFDKNKHKVPLYKDKVLVTE